MGNSRDKIRGIRQTIGAGTVVGRPAGMTKGPPVATRLIDMLRQSSGVSALINAHDTTINGTQVQIDNTVPLTDLVLLQYILVNNDWEYKSLSQVLDSVLGVTQGSVVYRGASAWAALGPSTAGFVLSTNGAGANPSWITPPSAAPNGAAGGYLSGTYPNPTVAKVKGTTTNDNAAAGDVGEYVTADVPIGSEFTVTSNTVFDVTSISLTAGDWDVSGVLVLDANAGTIRTSAYAWISATSATLPSAWEDAGMHANLSSDAISGQRIALPTGLVRFSLASTTTVFLSGKSAFSVSTMFTYGRIRARRIR